MRFYREDFEAERNLTKKSRTWLPSSAPNRSFMVGLIGNPYKGGKAATGAACYSGWGCIDLMRPALRDAGEEKWYHG